MKLYNNDRNKREFQSFVNFTKKINDSYFSGFTFYKKVLYHVSSNFIMFKHVKVGKNIERMRQNLSNNILIVKFHPWMKCLHIICSFFHPRMKI